MQIVSIFHPHADNTVIDNAVALLKPLVSSPTSTTRFFVSNELVSRYLELFGVRNSLPTQPAFDDKAYSPNRYTSDLTNFLWSEGFYEKVQLKSSYVPRNGDIIVVNAEYPMSSYLDVAIGVVIDDKAYFVSKRGGFEAYAVESVKQYVGFGVDGNGFEYEVVV